MAAKKRSSGPSQPEERRKNKLVGVRLPPGQREAVAELAERHALAASQVMVLALGLALRDGALDAACAEARRWIDALERKRA